MVCARRLRCIRFAIAKAAAAQRTRTARSNGPAHYQPWLPAGRPCPNYAHCACCIRAPPAPAARRLGPPPAPSFLSELEVAILHGTACTLALYRYTLDSSPLVLAVLYGIVCVDTSLIQHRRLISPFRPAPSPHQHRF